MPLITVASLRGSPGCTTLATEIARRWRVGSATLIEADPDGGCLATREGLASAPGLTELAASARAHFTQEALTSTAQRLHPRSSVVVAPCSPEQVHLAVRACAANLAAALAGASTQTTIVDVGRLRPASPTLPLVHAADIVLLIVDPTVESIAAVCDRAGVLDPLPAALVVTDRGAYSPNDVAAATGLGVLATIPRATSRRSRRRLTHAVERLADTLSAIVHQPGQPPASDDRAVLRLDALGAAG